MASQPCNEPRNSVKSLPNRHLEIAGMGDKFRMAKPTIRGEMPMWKASASVLCGCLAALPLLGCAGDVATPGKATAVMPPATTEPAPNYASAPRINAHGRAVPAAVVVLWPGDDSLARDPALWTAQGFDVVMPPPDIYRLVTDQQAALARLVASAHALADAPIWVVGPGPVIDAALAEPRPGRGGVSGVVMTSVTSGARNCSESFFYSDPGTGAPPKVEVKRSGDCGTGPPAIGGPEPSMLPAPRPNQPRLIEASAVGKSLPPAAKVRHLAAHQISALRLKDKVRRSMQAPDPFSARTTL
jgi:hypothetical protein